MSHVVSEHEFSQENALTFTCTDIGAAKPSALSCMYRRILFKVLDRLETGQLTVQDAAGTTRFGRASSGLRATVEVINPRFYNRVIQSGALGAAEAYLAGEWKTDDLTVLLRLFLQNRETLSGIGNGRSWLARTVARWGHLRRDNTQAGSRRNIHEHYDLGNDFFRLFLDETMMYSSAWFTEGQTNLREASEAKLDRICRKLDLNSNDHVLEIGTGWGGFAEYAAREYGCRVTTTTISSEQYDFARARIKAGGLTDRVTVLKQDYRTLTGQFDKLVSIEMIEAVGHKHLDQYFRVCSERLKPMGTMLLQAITIPDERYAQYLQSVDFIQKYIFPGGSLPSIGAMVNSTSLADLRLIHLEDFAESYARTLRAWRDRFFARRAEVAALGFGPRFQRMWEYYFCYCEAAFIERATGVAHLVFAKPDSRSEVRI